MADGDEQVAGGGWRKYAVVSSVVLGLVVVLGGLIAVATPKFGAARGRADQRACFANQKTLAGAIEAYVHDTQRPVPDLASVMKELLGGGFIYRIPDDPGQGAGTEGNYALVAAVEPCAAHRQAAAFDCPRCRALGSIEIVCRVHGSIRAPR